MSYQVGLNTVITDTREIVNISSAPVSGIVTAQIFYGDGTNLTGLGVSNLNATNNTFQSVVVTEQNQSGVGIATIDCSLGHNIDLYAGAPNTSGNDYATSRIAITPINVPTVVELRIRFINNGGRIDIIWAPHGYSPSGIASYSNFYIGQELEWNTVTPNYEWIEYSVSTIDGGRNWYGSIMSKGVELDTFQQTPPIISDYNSFTNPFAYQYPLDTRVSIGGSLFLSGYNASGQIGDNTTANKNTFTAPIGTGGSTFTDVSLGHQHTLGIRSDGSLWTWGNNGHGQLGNSNTVPRSSPAQVGSDTNHARVTAGNYVSYALRTNGDALAWGHNNHGQLGFNNTQNYSSPTSLYSTGIGWQTMSRIKQIWCRESTTGILTVDGQLWMCGHNNHGQIGNNDTNPRSSFTRVGRHNFWASLGEPWGGHGDGNWVSCLQTDGSIWSWGYNAHGELGNGNTVPRSSPVRALGNSVYKKIYNGHHGQFGHRTDDTLDFWGHNWYGQSGDGTSAPRSTPVRVMADKKWRKVSIGQVSIGIRTDGTLWGIGGYNQHGAMPSVVTGGFQSSPVLINAATDWLDITTQGHYFSAAIKRSPI